MQTTQHIEILAIRGHLAISLTYMTVHVNEDDIVQLEGSMLDEIAQSMVTAVRLGLDPFQRSQIALRLGDEKNPAFEVVYILR